MVLVSILALFIQYQDVPGIDNVPLPFPTPRDVCVEIHWHEVRNDKPVTIFLPPHTDSELTRLDEARKRNLGNFIQCNDSRI